MLSGLAMSTSDLARERVLAWARSMPGLATYGWTTIDDATRGAMAGWQVQDVFLLSFVAAAACLVALMLRT